MGKPCVPIKEKEQNHAILFLPGAEKTDIVWSRKQWRKRFNISFAPAQFIEELMKI